MKEAFSSPGAKRIRIFLFLLLVSLFSYGWFYYNSEDPAVKTDRIKKYEHSHDIMGIPPHHYLTNRPHIEVGLQASENKSRNTPQEYNGCPMPQLIPSPPSLQHFFKKGPEIDCEKKYPRLFNSTFESSLVPAKTPGYFRKNGIGSCCYRTVERDLHSSKPDRAQIVSSICFPLSFTNVTMIPVEHHLIAIYCKIEGGNDTQKMVDVHTFVHLKPRNNLIHTLSLSKGNTDKPRKYNVVIFGLDSVSRMNFLRTWGKSHDFLKQELGAVDMLGYNKVGENTFPCILTFLTSQTWNELRCLRNRYFDDCPFIWKEFSKEGYHTGYSEDYIKISMFNAISPGFRKQPTDDYPLPLADWADKHFTEEYCYGPRLSFQFLIEHMEKFVKKMGDNGQNYFHFTWATKITHDNMNIGYQLDPYLLRSLKELKQEGYFNDTIFILMSDHGLRVTDLQFQFRTTIQGQLENRLPLAYFVMPESFKMEYERAYRNLISNRDKLMTTFDMHETLKDILSLRTIEESSLIEREAYLSDLGKRLTRGISLFLPIPKFRTCKMAGIPLNYCTCTRFQGNLTGPEVTNVAMVGVAHINAILHNVSQCAPLQLDRVTMAGLTSDQEFNSYLINFDTKPGGAQFEALVRRKKGNGEVWNVLGTVDRTNSHHDKSRCVEAGQLRHYCHCKNLPNTQK